MTRNIGVMKVLPFSLMNSLSPCHSFLVLKKRAAKRTTPFSPSSSCSVSLTSVYAVQSRNAPKM